MKWKIVELGQIAETTSGGTPSRTKPENWAGAIPWVKSGELRDCYINSSEEFITEIGLNNSSAKLFAPGTLLLALYGATAGKLGILGFPASTNQAVCGITPQSDILHTKYLYHFLLSKRKQIITDSFGGAQPNISQGYVRKLKVPVPPISVQRHIADTLDKADELRRKDQELLLKYDELAQSIFSEMFGDPMSNEKGWEPQKLGSLARITSGATPNRSKAEYYIDGTVPWVKTGDLKKRYLTTASEFITDKAIKESSAKVFPQGTVLVALYGATIGACSVLAIPAATNQACGAILPSEAVLEEFLYWYFITIKDKLIALGVGGAQPNISGQILKSLDVIVPPRIVQEEFCERVNNVFSQKEAALKAHSASSMLFEKLLSTHFTMS